MADYSYDSTEASSGGLRAGKIVNLTGAALSLALVAGIGVWGYKLVLRDVSGVPVVKAMAGPLRVAPTDPGGEIAMNTGLAVNAVAAVGEAEAPEDRVLLAPKGVEMTEEDYDVAEEPVEVSAEPEDESGGGTELASHDVPKTSITGKPEKVQTVSLDSSDPERPLTDDEVLALADQIAAGVQPLTALEAGETKPVKASLGAAEASDSIARSVPGVSMSVRPQGRPAVVRSQNNAAKVTKAVAETPAVDPQSLTPGTELVQLGAFESREVAQSEWQRLAGRFGDFMADKSPVIERAESGGRTFYRLRATGFSDLSGARRFCSALVAEDAACIPVVAR